MRGVMLAAALALALTGCPGKLRKPDLPGAGSIVVPQVQFVDRVRYVRIPADLTVEQPVAEGPLAQCPTVAADRRAAITRGNSLLRQIRAIQGTDVPPAATP